MSFYQLLTEPNVGWVFFGTIVLSIAASCSGVFAWLNRRSLIGDAMSHCALPGIAIAFLFAQSRHPLVILPAALVSALLGNSILNWLSQRVKISPDSAMAIVLSGFFAIGATLLSIIQKLPIAGKAGLDRFLFGQVAALDDLDVLVLSSVALCVIAVIVILFPRLRMVSFDPVFSQTTNSNTKWYRSIISLLIVFCVVIGIQIVGVVLMSALLIFPAIIARQWQHHLYKLLFVASTLAVLASVAGVSVSLLVRHMPTGPWIVVFLAVFAFFSFLFAPSKGLLLREILFYRKQMKIDGENIVRVWFLLYIDYPDKHFFSFSDVLKKRQISSSVLQRGVQYALTKKWLESHQEGFRMTKKGIKVASLITRHHRLWEKYLNQKKNIPIYATHHSAEHAEHVIDTTLGEKIDESLGHPSTDPHGREIPK